MEQVDGDETVEQADVRMARALVEGAAQLGEQAGEGVDGDRAPGLERGLGDEHRQGRLPGADVAGEAQALAGLELGGDVVGEAPDGSHDDGVHVHDRGAIERHAAVAPRDHGGQGARPGAADALGAAATVARGLGVGVDHEAAAVAHVVGAGPGHAKRSSAT
jgi:hypothetical protein